MSRANNIEKTKSIISNERESFETCQTSQILGNDTIDSQQKQCSEADNLWVTVSWKLKTIALFSIMMLSSKYERNEYHTITLIHSFLQLVLCMRRE